MTSPLTTGRLVAGLVAGLALATGAGAAYAVTSSTGPDDPGPSGYAVVVDERQTTNPVTSPATSPATSPGCPSTDPTSGADA
jgi:hypothetical protein